MIGDVVEWFLRKADSKSLHSDDCAEVGTIRFRFGINVDCEDLHKGNQRLFSFNWFDDKSLGNKKKFPFFSLRQFKFSFLKFNSDETNVKSRFSVFFFSFFFV